MASSDEALDEFTAVMGTIAGSLDELARWSVEWRADFAIMDARGLGCAGLSKRGGFFTWQSQARGLALALKDDDGDGPAALGWRMPPLLVAADDIILACYEEPHGSLWHVADEARHGRFGVLIATTPERRAEWITVITEKAPNARTAVVNRGDTEGWLNAGGTA